MACMASREFCKKHGLTIDLVGNATRHNVTFHTGLISFRLMNLPATHSFHRTEILNYSAAEAKRAFSPACVAARMWMEKHKLCMQVIPRLSEKANEVMTIDSDYNLLVPFGECIISAIKEVALNRKDHYKEALIAGDQHHWADTGCVYEEITVTKIKKTTYTDFPAKLSQYEGSTEEREQVSVDCFTGRPIWELDE